MRDKKILIVCPYPRGVAPSQRLKFEQYYDSWEKNGFEITVDSFQSLAFWDIIYKNGGVLAKIYHTFIGYCHRFIRLFSLHRFDIVYIHLWVTPFGAPFFEWLYTTFSKKTVYDIDDLIFMKNASSANAWVATLKGKSKPIFLMKKANFIITTTPFLVDFCKKYNQNVIGIPPTLDEKKIFPVEQNKSHKLTIGWIGSHTTESYLDLTKAALEKLAKQMDFKLVLMGAAKFSIENIETEYIEWSPEMENDMLNQLDIALYPLRDEKWSQGKFGGKLIQYFAAGLPTVVSDVNSSNKSIIQNNRNGILVNNTTDEWYAAIYSLAMNSLLREEIGKAARADFLAHFSIRANEPKYLQVLNSLAG